MNADDIRAVGQEYAGLLRDYRRYLHMHPELSFQEVNTAAWIRDHLRALDIPMLDGIQGNSTVGVLKGEMEGPTLLFRADIDALPIVEENDLPFASQNHGVMHACGHDAHTATLLCLADYMSHHRELIRGTLKLVFQQGEDAMPGGGRFIVQDGVLDDVDRVFAWHCAPEVAVGDVVAAGGARTASFASLDIRIQGQGGHGGFPHRSVDSVSTAASVISAINDMHGWEIDPMESAAIIISHLETGQHAYYNVIPDTAIIEGCIRTHNNEVAEHLYQRVDEIVRGICLAKGCKGEIEWHKGYPALINDPVIADRLRGSLLTHGIHAIVTRPIMGAEDFGFYTMVRPGTYFNVGTRDPADERTFYPPHSPYFRIDERAMEYALETLVVTYLTESQIPGTVELRSE